MATHAGRYAAWQGMGEPRRFFLVPSNEPATIAIEQEMERTLATRYGNGYVELEATPQLQAGKRAAPNEIRSDD